MFKIYLLQYYDDNNRYFAFSSERNKLEHLIQIWKDNGKDTKFDVIIEYEYKLNDLEKLTGLMNSILARYDSQRNNNPWFKQANLV